MLRPRSQDQPDSPLEHANTKAAIRLSTKVRPKIIAILPLFACSSLRPAARCHGLANSIGEYHRPPSTNELTAHSSTAIIFTSGIFIPPIFVSRRRPPPPRSDHEAIAARRIVAMKKPGCGRGGCADSPNRHRRRVPRRRRYRQPGDAGAPRTRNLRFLDRPNAGPSVPEMIRALDITRPARLGHS